MTFELRILVSLVKYLVLEQPKDREISQIDDLLKNLLAINQIHNWTSPDHILYLSIARTTK